MSDWQGILLEYVEFSYRKYEFWETNVRAKDLFVDVDTHHLRPVYDHHSGDWITSVYVTAYANVRAPNERWYEVQAEVDLALYNIAPTTVLQRAHWSQVLNLGLWEELVHTYHAWKLHTWGRKN